MSRALLLSAVLSLLPVAAHAQSDTAQVTGALTRFFDAARTKDTATVRASFDEAARLTLLRPDPNGGVRVMTLGAQQFVQAVAGGSGLDEPIRNLRIMIDGDLASVWAEYQVRANGAVTHCGYDAFHLVRRPTGWKILSIADSFRREGCGPAWK
ncbi:MAG: nuclear transport factor 2 family protein [Gemmatimonadetes bacterium]|nr:nuclear transport factor 2 family protein [Gemmatimonadota bacterium]